ncbi:hypothetical protein HDV03_003578 [Kappamyces sp. JEL0829]|nr:hypothetical protein HDV03_003578 [Kappamyces sp. JEL0829]
MAGDSIEINGIPYSQAFEDQEPEYEPLDEALRQKADDLSNQVQAKMVKIATMRKTLPGQIDDLNRETIRLLTSTTDKSHIEPDPAAEAVGTVEARPLVLDGFETICQQQSQLSKELPETLEKAHQIENLLNDLDIPLLPATQAKASRRRSSLGRSFLAKSSSHGPVSPGKAAEGLLKTLGA